MKKYILYLILALPAFIDAQTKTNTHFAVSGPQGIIVKNFAGPCSPYDPMKDGTVQIRVDRKSSRESDYKSIGIMRTPNTYHDGLDRYQRFSNYAIHPNMVNQKNFEFCWNTLSRTHSYDSCVFYIIEPTMALTMGFYLYDITVDENTEYQYRLVKQDKNGADIGTQESEKVKWNTETGFKKAFLNKKDANELHADLTYKMKGEKKPRFFKTFRKQGYNGTWDLIDPVITIKSAKDSVSMNLFDNTSLHGNNYYYFIQPSDMYGNLGPCSDTVQLFTSTPKDIPLPYLFRTKYDNMANKVKIDWKLDNPFMVSKVELYRSKTFDKGFELLTNLSPFDTTYNDITAKPMTRYYYYFMVYDQIGRKTAKSAVMYGLLEDFNIPNAPYVVSAEPLEKGIKIQLLIDTTNLAGYYIYRSVGHDTSKLVQVSSLVQTKNKETNYIDTGFESNVAYGFTYFAKAVSTSHINSDFSNPQYAQPLIKRTSKFPIVTDLSYSLKVSFVTLFWKSLHNIDAGIIAYNAYKREVGTSSWILINPEKINGIRTIYSDSIEEGNWEYMIKAIHTSNAESEAGNIVRINNFHPISPPSNLVLYPSKTGVSLQWQTDYSPLIKAFRIYKITDGKIEKIGEVSNSEFTFTDTSATKSGFYEYYITKYLQNGKETKGSANKSIEID